MCYIIGMNNTKKIAVFMALFIVVCSYSFGETLYGFTVNVYYRQNETFSSENYGRELEGASFNIMLNHFPQTFPIGWYIKASLGMVHSALEWKGNNIYSNNSFSSSELRISGGASYNVKLGSIFMLPISLGPVFSSSREDTYYYSDGYYNNYVSGFISAFNLGLHADVALVLNPFRRFTIITGMNIGWDFLRWERGYIDSAFRNVNKIQYEFTNYNAFTIGFYLGLGIRSGGNTNRRTAEAAAVNDAVEQAD